MAETSPVHVELRENGWAVVREGSERATSVHRTQSEAAKEGRDIARRGETEFFLHAQDGRVREHRSYGEGARSAEEAATDQTSGGPLDAVTETVGQLATGVSATVGALGRAGESSSRGSGRSGPATRAAGSGETSSEESDDKGEARDLAGDQHDDRSLEERYAGYGVYDERGERIGKLEDLFVDEADNPEYVGVRAGSPGAGSALIPADVITVDDRLRRMVVSLPKGVVEAGPTYGAHEEVTPEFEERVRSHYGISGERGAVIDRGAYGAYYPDAERTETGVTGPETVGPAAGSAASGKAGTLGREGAPGLGRAQDDDELRVRRIEEELKVGTREREVGAVRVRKRIVTEHERIVVPKKRVEVTVEHVPIEGEAIPAEEGTTTAPEIGEDEIVVPVVEEEVVVEKRPVVKEEVRIRKEVVEESEVVEEDVRREEVEVDDQTPRQDL